MTRIYYQTSYWNNLKEYFTHLWLHDIFHKKVFISMPSFFFSTRTPPPKKKQWIRVKFSREKWVCVCYYFKSMETVRTFPAVAVGSDRVRFLQRVGYWWESLGGRCVSFYFLLFRPSFFENIFPFHSMTHINDRHKSIN